MHLYCVRHGEANSADVDPQRGLTDKGKSDVTKVAQFLKQRDLHLSHILHSPKLRAVQTAQLFAEHLGITQVDECDSILDEDADLEAILGVINTLHENTMIVGHLPFMAKLISALVINNEDYFPIVNYPPGAVVCLDHYENGRWIVNWILRPNIVPDR